MHKKYSKWTHCIHAKKSLNPHITNDLRPPQAPWGIYDKYIKMIGFQSILLYWWYGVISFPNIYQMITCIHKMTNSWEDAAKFRFQLQQHVSKPLSALCAAVFFIVCVMNIKAIGGCDVLLKYQQRTICTNSFAPCSLVLMRILN